MSWEATQTLRVWIATQKKDMERLQRNLLDVVALSHWRAIDNLGKKSRDALGSSDESPVVQTLKDSLLDKLAYNEISDREERIPQAFQKTFEWIFSDPIEAEDSGHPWSSFKTGSSMEQVSTGLRERLGLASLL
jgi:hypothetical protein